MQRNSNEVVPNLQLGFWGFWRVSEDYEVFEGRLCDRGPPTRSYAPMLHPEIASEISKLQREDEEQVLKFARMYGALGYDSLIPPEELARGGAVPIGDPLPWVWAHADTIRICSELSYLLQEGDSGALRTYIQSLWVASEDIGEHKSLANKQGRLAIAVVAKGRRILRQEWGWIIANRRTADDDVEAFARYMRRDLINENIAGIRRMLFDTGKKDCGFFEFRALIETAYWHLANAVDGGRLKRCEAEGCGAVFIQRDPRQHFCPPLSPKQESRCAVRSRVRKYRKK